VLGAGCTSTVLYDPSLATVPRAWRNHHPWGPEANEARDQGRLPYLVYSPRMACWAEFAREYLQDGDVVFRLGRSYSPYGCYTSRMLANISASPFSHDGIVCREHDRVWVYDVETEGVRKIPFEVWMIDVTPSRWAIKRLKPEHRDRIPLILAFCEESYQKNIPFDFTFAPGDDKFYCTEMVERAFQSAGLPLSAPEPIRSQPNFARYRVLGFIVQRFLKIDLDTPVYAAGNLCHGTYSSPELEPLYQAERATAILKSNPAENGCFQREAERFLGKCSRLPRGTP
jgi:hypothetical protein